MMTGYTGARGNGIFDDLRFSSEIVHLGLPLTIYDALASRRGLYPFMSQVALAKEDSKQDDNGNWNS
jgi:hypothetical protein